MKRRFLLTLAILTAPAGASAATRVSSESNCPSSDAISVRLLGLLAAGGPESASARVRVDDQSLRIELSTPGETNQERTIPVTADCDERAEVAALIIASWLDAMPQGNLKAPGIPPREGSEIVRMRGGGHDPDEPATRTSGRTLVGVGVLGLADTQGGDGGLVVCAAMPELIEDFGLLFETSLGYRRELAVGQGIARYWRPTAALEVSAAILRKRWGVRVVVGPTVGVLAVSGSRYDQNLSDTTVTWGVDFGLVLTRAWDDNEAWLSLGAIAWPQERKIRTKSSLPGSEAGLPEWEGRLSAGFSWGVLEWWK
jgi:hypothetical protein